MNPFASSTDRTLKTGRRSTLAFVSLSTLAAFACSSEPTPGDGSVPVTGGAAAAGGATAVGGAASGGIQGSGGQVIPATGGQASGGNASTGGDAASSGGTTGVGGTDPGSGGAAASGGAAGTGGGAPIVEPSFVTSAPNDYWKVGNLTEGSGNAAINIQPDQVLGEWRGWGGTFNEKGWDVMKSLSDADRDLAIHLLFDAADGARFTYGRVPIGSSDYALNRYSLNENAGDFEMTKFSIDRDRQDLIPYIHAALAVQPNIHFWGSPWSPPTWMKDNGQFDRGNIKTDAQTLGAHALYLARFVEEYEKEGIHFEAIHPQNEPGYLQDYPSCGWSAQTMTGYIKNQLGPLFAERLPDTEIWMGTMSANSDKGIVDAVMADSAAAGFISGIGTQWGQDQYVAGYISSYHKPVMQTEHRCGNFPNGNNTTKAPNDDAYARESWGYIKTYIKNGVSSYMAWNMVLDTGGRNLDTVRPWAQNALLAVDVAAKKLIITPTYYLFRHLSQYVDEGSSRIAVTGGDSLAWKNPDGDIVLVTYNSQNSAAQTTVGVAGKVYQVTIPGQGWATVNIQAP